MPIPNNQIRVVEAQMQGIRSSEGSTSRNYNFVFHYRRTTVSNVPDEAAFDVAFQNTVGNGIINVLNNTYTQTTNVIRFVDDALRASFLSPQTAPGQVTGDSMPSHAATYLLFRTALRGKSYRGSKHFGPLSESDTTAGSADILNAAALTAYGTLKTALLAPLVDGNGNTWVPCVLSRKAPAQYRTNPTNVITNDVTNIFINKRIGNMRRRTVKSVY